MSIVFGKYKLSDCSEPRPHSFYTKIYFAWFIYVTPKLLRFNQTSIRKSPKALQFSSHQKKLAQLFNQDGMKFYQMKRSFIVVFQLAVLFSLLIGCLAIIGGTYAPFYPFFVTVEVRNKYPCGGTLIAADFVLTSAYCLFHKNEDRYAYSKEVTVLKKEEKLQFLKIPLRKTRKYAVERYIYHKQFTALAREG